MSDENTKNLIELALNYWRLEKWIEQTTSDTKRGALRSVGQIKKYLEAQKITMMDLTGERYDNGFAVDILDIESKEKTPEDKCYIKEMVRPIILLDGSVISFGKVILTDQIEETPALIPPVSPNEALIQNLQKDIDAYCKLDDKDKNTAYHLFLGKVKLERRLLERRK